MDILNFGSLNIDFVYKVDEFLRPGETKLSKSLDFFCGGKGLNQSIALARSGATVYHAGCIGNDGEMLHKILQGRSRGRSLLSLPGHRLPRQFQHRHFHRQRSRAASNHICRLGKQQILTLLHIAEFLVHFSVVSCFLLINLVTECWRERMFQLQTSTSSV